MRRWRSVLLICGGILVIGVMWLAGSGWGASGAAVQFVLREEIRGPYWTVDEGFQARLMLSNTTDEPIRVYPEVYAATGEGVVLPWLALREHERREVDLGAWLSEQGVEFTSGSLRLRHTGGFYALAAQVTLVNTARSWSFDLPVEPPGLFHRSRVLEGVWWVPGDGGEARLVVSNTLEARLPVEVTAPTPWVQITSTTVDPPFDLDPAAMGETVPLRVRVHHSAGMSGQAVTVSIRRVEPALDSCLVTAPLGGEPEAQQTRVIASTQTGERDLEFAFDVVVGLDSCDGLVRYQAMVSGAVEVTVRPPVQDEALFQVERAKLQIKETSFPAQSVAPGETVQLTVRVHHSAGVHELVGVRIARADADACVLTTPLEATQQQAIDVVGSGDLLFVFDITVGVDTCQGNFIYAAELLPLPGHVVYLRPAEPDDGEGGCAVLRSIWIESAEFLPPGREPGQSSALTVVVRSDPGVPLGTAITVRVEMRSTQPAAGCPVVVRPTVAELSHVLNPGDGTGGSTTYVFTITVDSGSCAGTVTYHASITTASSESFTVVETPHQDATLTVSAAASGELRLFLDVEDNFDVSRPRSDIDEYLPGAKLDGRSVSLPQRVKLIAAFVDSSTGAIVAPPSGVDQVSFALQGTSAFKGIAMNSGSETTADFSLSATTASFSADHTARVDLVCHDYGGFTTVRASAGGQTVEMRVPKDDNGNWLPDGVWRVIANGRVIGEIMDTGLATDADEDVNPMGNGVDGDGLVNFEEFRGFMVRGEHRRTNPFQKDLFISSDLPQNIGDVINLPVTKHWIFKIRWMRTGSLTSIVRIPDSEARFQRSLINMH